MRNSHSKTKVEAIREEVVRQPAPVNPISGSNVRSAWAKSVIRQATSLKTLQVKKNLQSSYNKFHLASMSREPTKFLRTLSKEGRAFVVEDCLL
jgi:hypothetical protein